jgi:DNA polymerase-3 subunit alpha
MSVSVTSLTRRIFVQSDFFHIHAHSEYSWLDGMGSVAEMVEVVEQLGQPALALTDHGVMAGCLRLYKLCRKAGIEPYPGEEFYLVKSLNDDTKTIRYHVGLLALTAKGYEGLVALSSRSHTRERFHKKPLIDLQDLIQFGFAYGEGVALTTGCFFGLPIQTLRNEGMDEAMRVVQMYAHAFPNTFVELQHHAVHDDDHDDDEIVEQMMLIAHTLGLPVVAGQDSHYCHHDWKPAHDMMKEISYHGTDGDDYKFPGDSFHLADVDFVRSHYTARQWDSIEEGHGALLDLHRLRLPDLDTYRFHVPEISRSPDAALKRVAKTGLHMRGFDIVDTYERRMNQELEVIEAMEFANYFLLVKDVTDWARKNGIVINARGSANGSLVCWALGITSVDPLQWDTDFSRFLSLDRKKPPDIDLDVESGRRADVIEYLRTQFPTMVHIGTYGRLGMEMDEMGQEKGSLYRQYIAAKRRRDEWDGQVAPKDQKPLELLSMMDVRKSAGCHAGGLILAADSLPISRLIPTMLIPSSNTTVTQPVMEDVEEAGYVKLDLLGVRALETLNECLWLIGRRQGDLDWIKWDDAKTATTLRSGRTMGIFQFEGPSSSRGAKKMKLKTTEDAILALALFRPALMNGGQTERYLQARESGKPVKVPQLLERLLQGTLGVPLFQEQVIDIMRLVGLPFEELNDVLKAVKASNDKIGDYAQDIMRKTAPRFRKLAVSAGMTLDEAKAAWRMVRDFSDYGFNRAHAVSYGIMAYRAAYLKTHFPLEFMTATLTTWAGTDKERPYIQEARRLGFTIVKADVNHSAVGWTMERGNPSSKVPRRKNGSIRRGLLTVKGVGLSAAEAIVDEHTANGPYTDVDDFIDRLPARPVSGGKSYRATGEFNGVMLKLAEASALRSLGYTL